MAMMPASETRRTRNQVASADNLPLSTPSSFDRQANGTYSRAGRRVLAELACNDSPIVGLLPAGTPNSSCKDRSGDGGIPRSRRALITETLSSQPACTPLGESLLRSQVQLLLQKIESEIGGNHHQQEKVPSLNLGGAMVASPTMLAAPTPLNTPASVIMAQLQHPSASDRVPLRDATTDASKDKTRSLASSSSCLSKEQPDSPEDMCTAASLGSCCLLNPTATGASASLPALSSGKVSDTPSSEEIFVGKRMLNFDNDMPCKISLEEGGLNMILSEGEADCGPASWQLEDDEVSEWSVNVNVGSPADKESLIELSENTVNGSPFIKEDPSMLCEHVRMMQQVSSSKVQLLWDKDNERKTFEYGKDSCGQKEVEKNDMDKRCIKKCSEYVDEHSSHDQDDDCHAREECDDLCDMFTGMRFEETGHGLPKGEGKHIRFLYDDGDDEIAEAVVVSGEEDLLRSSAAIRLKGLPVPSGRHWRFSQDD